MGFFNRGFEHHIQKMMAAADDLDSVRAIQHCLKAAHSVPDGIERLEDLAWNLTRNAKPSRSETYCLMVLSQELTLTLCPNNPVGWIAAAKISIECGHWDKFEENVQNAEATSDSLQVVEKVGLSTFIYRLRKKFVQEIHQRGPSEFSPRQSIELTTQLCKYGGVVLDRIEAGAQLAQLPPDLWEWYAKICEEWPIYGHRLHIAKKNLSNHAAGF